MKKFASLLLTLTLLLCFGTAGVFATEAELQPQTPTLNTTDSAAPMFFANGTPIVITARTDGTEGAHIAWDGGEMDVTANTSVFGGGHEHDGAYASSSIVMKGGTVRNLIGGGLHKSYVKNTSVILEGGTVTGVNGGGASSMSGTTCHKPWYAGDPKQSPCKVDNAVVKVSGGTVKSLLFGGGEGISYTGTSSLTITGGDMSSAWVTAGGSNGYTGTASVDVQGGTIKVLQSVNRGSMDSAEMKVTGGTVDAMYAGGETGDTSVTGTISGVSVDITGGTVTKLEPGTTGGTVIAPDSGILDVAYIPDSVGNSENLGDAFGESVKTIFTVTFEANGGSLVDSQLVKDGDAIAKPTDPTKNGYVFKGWYADKALTKAWDFDTKITADTTLYADWKEVSAQTPAESEPVDTDNPKTGDSGVLPLALLILCLPAAAGALVLKKKEQ